MITKKKKKRKALTDTDLNWYNLLMPSPNYPHSRFNSQHRALLVVVLVVFGVLSFAFTSNFAFAGCSDIDDLDDRAKCIEKKLEEKEGDFESTSKKLSEVRALKDSVSNTISDLSSSLSITQGEIDGLQANIDSMVNELNNIDKELAERNIALGEKIHLRNTAIRNYYQNGILNGLEMFFASNIPAELNGFQFSTMSYVFEKTLTSESVKLIGVLNSEIRSFEADKKEATALKDELETSQKEVIALKTQLDAQRLAAEKEYNDLHGAQTSYEGKLANLQEQIDSLSKQQQAIIAAKAGNENGTVGDFESPGWSVPKPPFKPAFGAFSYGAYTHYNGMSQYGAKGRADDGQDYKKIIEHYYKTGVKEEDDFPDKIEVQGHGEMDFQYYLYGIAEMPSDWHVEALKVQAIAARTYAYKSNKPICTTQSCQVFLKSKADNPPDRWKEAVDDTENKILDNPSTSQYSSTTGGYLNQSGWDVDGKWPGDAYERKADSPWFYWAWYSESYRFDSATCGRDHPWLSSEEMADILNAIVVWDKGSGSDQDHISPITTSCWGGDPWSHDKMKEKAGNYGTAYDSVSGVDVDIGNNGQTQKVTFSTNKGSVSIDGNKFKTVFNLRAPSYIAIKSRLYDIEYEN